MLIKKISLTGVILVASLSPFIGSESTKMCSYLVPLADTTQLPSGAFCTLYSAHNYFEDLKVTGHLLMLFVIVHLSDPSKKPQYTVWLKPLLVQA